MKKISQNNVSTTCIYIKKSLHRRIKVQCIIKSVSMRKWLEEMLIAAVEVEEKASGYKITI